jgi:dipeptidase E
VPLDSAVRTGSLVSIAECDGVRGLQRRERGDDPDHWGLFVNWQPPDGGDRALGMVDFSIFPHLDHEDMPAHAMANAEQWAADMPRPAYAIDDQTAIRLADGAADVISEGHWKLFNP